MPSPPSRARQIKRWTGKWGFVKNIPAKEMRKMVRVRQRRQQQLGRPTKFLRDPGAGGLQEVPLAKLDAYEQRFGGPSVSALSSSSGLSPPWLSEISEHELTEKDTWTGLPSNIVCQTPSSRAALTSTPRVESNQVVSTPRSAQEMAQEFNNSTIQVFTNGRSDNDDSDEDCHQDANVLPYKEDIRSLWSGTIHDVFDGKYQLAAQKSKRIIQLDGRGLSRIVCRFRIDVMDAACYPGSPQSLIARIADIIARTLGREREEYTNSRSDMPSEAALRRVLYFLQKEARYLAHILVRQRALQIWEPLLRSDHPKIAKMQADLAFERRTFQFLPTRPLKDFADETGIDVLSELSDMHQMQSLGEQLGDLVQLGDAPDDQLLEKLRIIESGGAPGQKLTRELSQQRRGRSKALLGLFLSFVSRFTDAEKAFKESEQLMEHETCLEIKLHRLLWYAEHRTRVQGWDGVTNLIIRAHEIFMANETTSEFIIHHFPDRFKALCSAVSRRVPIDTITSEVANSQLPSPAPDTPLSIHHPSPTPTEHNSALSPLRFFPPTPRGANAVINIDAWREFVHFTPTIGGHL